MRYQKTSRRQIHMKIVSRKPAMDVLHKQQNPVMKCSQIQQHWITDNMLLYNTRCFLLACIIWAGLGSPSGATNSRFLQAQQVGDGEVTQIRGAQFTTSSSSAGCEFIQTPGGDSVTFGSNELGFNATQEWEECFDRSSNDEEFLGTFFGVTGHGGKIVADTFAAGDDGPDDTALMVFRADGCADDLPTCIAKNDDADGVWEYDFINLYRSKVEWFAEEGVKYIVLATGPSWDPGHIGLTIRRERPGSILDTCGRMENLVQPTNPRSIDLTQVKGLYYGSMEGSTVSSDVPTCEDSNLSTLADDPPRDVFYMVEGIGGRITIASDMFELSIFESDGPSCYPEVQCIASVQENIGTRSVITWYSKANTFYHIRLREIAEYKDTTEGSFLLEIQAQFDDVNTFIPDDRCEVPIQLPFLARRDNLITTYSRAPLTCPGKRNGEMGTFYKIYGDGEIIKATSCGSALEGSPIVSVYKSDIDEECLDESSLTCLDYDVPPSESECSTVSWNSEVGTVYYVMVSRCDSDDGSCFCYDDPPDCYFRLVNGKAFTLQLERGTGSVSSPPEVDYFSKTLTALDYSSFLDKSSREYGDCPTGDSVDKQLTTDQVCIERDGSSCNIGWTRPEEHLDYEFFVANTGYYDADMRVAARFPQEVKLFLSFVGPNGLETVSLRNFVPVEANGGWQDFYDMTLYRTIPLERGNYQLRVFFTTGQMNLCSIRFYESISKPTVLYSALLYTDASFQLDRMNIGDANCPDGKELAPAQLTQDEGCLAAFSPLEESCNIGWIRPGDWLTYGNLMLLPGSSVRIWVRMANRSLPPSTPERKVKVSLNGDVCELMAPGKGSQTFETVVCPNSMPSRADSGGSSGELRNSLSVSFPTGYVNICAIGFEYTS